MNSSERPAGRRVSELAVGRHRASRAEPATPVAPVAPTPAPPTPATGTRRPLKRRILRATGLALTHLLIVIVVLSFLDSSWTQESLERARITSIGMVGAVFALGLDLRRHKKPQLEELRLATFPRVILLATVTPLAVAGVSAARTAAGW